MSPKFGVCYYPEHWPQAQWAADAQRMRQLGLTYVRIGEFAWSRLEPEDGVFAWDWLDKAIKTLGEAGLEIMLGTPTATPPRWMLSKYPDMLAYDAEGRPRKFGSRRHYCFSHEGYKAECVRMAGLLGERYGRNPHIHSWQIDNEYGCHDTTLSYSPASEVAFRIWLAKKYETIHALNEAWGNVFWSMEYTSFEDIDLPNLTVTEPNPAHFMDFRRFSSDQVVAFNKAQVEALRQYTDLPLIHNYMGRITDFDHFDVGKDLEIASWDSYPLGFLEDRSDQNDAFRHSFQRQGDPDFAAFHHDLYRAVGKDRWGVMEQQPGPVNWAPYNPAPLPGMVRLWTWEAFAHGAEFVNYFRWKQAPFAQEQMHAAVLRPDGEPAQAWPEVQHTAQEIARIDWPETSASRVGLVFDYTSAWAWDIQPQGRDFNYFRLVFDCYAALRRRGLSVDILPPHTEDFGDRDVVLVPGLFCWNDSLLHALGGFEGQCLIGPRTGSKTSDFQIPPNLPPNIPGMDIKVISAESLRPGEQIELESGGHIHIWHENIETSEAVSIRLSNGRAGLISKGNSHYLCGWPDAHGLSQVLTKLGLPNADLPEGVRYRDAGHFRLVTNYNAETVSVNGIDMKPASIRVIDIKNDKIIIS